MGGYMSKASKSCQDAKEASSISQISPLADTKTYTTGYAARLGDLLETEYPMLKGVTYLDHGGTTIYAKSLIDDFSKDMSNHLYGNPHSDSDPSALSSGIIDDVRERALRFFGADPEHFDLVFTANATAAIKLVADTMRDASLSYGDANIEEKDRISRYPNFWYGFHRDSHTSLVGIREITGGDYRCFESDEEIQQWFSSPEPILNTKGLGLFAYPGQSNMTGQRFPISWCRSVRQRSDLGHLYSLYDASALATTSPLNKVFLDTENAPDFTVLSFYKIFGFPDLGALIVRKASSDIFSRRRYFGGGTVGMVITLGNSWHAMHEVSLHSCLEDGTLPFHSIVALGHAIRLHERLYGPVSMKNISRHTLALREQLYTAMSSLVHGNSRMLCSFYGDNTINRLDAMKQGPTIAFNLKKSDGTYWAYTEVEKLANAHRIFLRSGGLCNPGGIASSLEMDSEFMKKAYEAGHRCGGGIGTDVFEGKPTGVVRVGLGAMSTSDDVSKFLSFLADVFVE